jgi:DNA-binding CsgD family transcriptional regulator
MSSALPSEGSAAARPATQLLGRRGERERLERLLQAARGGAGGALVVRGDPGVGKTALLDFTVAAASDFGVAKAVGIEGEMAFPFAALQQLCSPFLGLADRLPSLQRDALTVAFGLSSGPTPNEFLIGLAVLGLFSEAGEERPLLCVVDDAHWLDGPSEQALAFVGRRLLAERVAFVFGTRQLDAALATLPELHVGPLGHRDSRDLLESVLPSRLDDRVLDRIVAEAAGNPLALLELPRGLTPAQLAGGFAQPAALPLTAQIEESFARRLEDLAPQPRLLLLLAAAEPVGDPALLWRAAQLLGIEESAGQVLESDGLLTLAPGVAFRYPLIRSAVYGSAAADELVAVHTALAEATDSELDPDRRAWHRAQAVAGPDEDLAADLQRSAARAQERGGLAAAAAFLERAAALTVEPSLRVERALAAAQAKLQSGSLEQALELIAGAEEDQPDERQHALLRLLRAQLAVAGRRGGQAAPALLGAARELEAIDPALARATYVGALNAALIDGRLGSVSLAEAGAAALAGPPPPSPPAPDDLLLEGTSLWFTESYATGVPVMREALRGFRDDLSEAPLAWRRLQFAIWAAAELWDEESWIFLSEMQLRRARETGELTAVPSALASRSIIFAMAGELAAAASLIEEMQAIADAAAVATTPSGAPWFPAWAGDEAALEELSRVVSEDAGAHGEGFGLAIVELVSAVMYNGLGRYEDAMAAVRNSIEETHDLATPIASVVELVEAAVRCGERALAERALDRVLERTEVARTSWALGTAARCRALLAEDDAAEDLYREAIERLEPTRLRVDVARAQLLYGEWLRRQGRRLDAREQLRRAHELFTALGTTAFAGRARRELQAAGERPAAAPAERQDELTSQEAQVARLAADGRTNREIAAEIFISPSTVEYHLRKVFRKLDVRSRTQLVDRLGESVSAEEAL